MSEKITKAATITAIAEKTGVPKKQIEAILDATGEVLTETLTAGNSVALLGGAFKPAHRAAREGVNPQHPGEKIQIAASNGVNFKPGSELKGALNK